MGTRSTTRVIDAEGNTYLNAYRQFDGYIAGHGVGLAAFLNTQRLTNGIPVSRSPGEGKVWSNGPGCLAAQLVAFLKKGPGNFYLSCSRTVEEYDYTVFVDDLSIHVRVGHSNKGILFEGTLAEFTAYVAGPGKDQ